MSRRTKNIPLEISQDIKEVIVKEVSPFAVYKGLRAEDPIKYYTELLQECIDLPKERLQNLYASEIETLVDGFLEVNSSFLGIAAKLNLKQTLAEVASKLLSSLPQLADEMQKSFPPAFSILFKQAMDKLPGIMDGDTSSSLSKPSQKKRKVRKADERR